MKKEILEAFKWKKRSKSYSQISKLTKIPKPYLSFLFNHFTWEDIEKINTDKLKELEETIKTKNRRIKELKSQLENCTCWEELSFFEKFDLATFYIVLEMIIGGISFLIAFYLKLRLFNG